MGIFKRTRHSLLEYKHETPLPPYWEVGQIKWQKWAHLDKNSKTHPDRGEWVTTARKAPPVQCTKAMTNPLRIVSWNIDSRSQSLGERTHQLLNNIFSWPEPVDAIMLQEVTPEALAAILNHKIIGHSWWSSELSFADCAGQPFTNVTLLNMATFLPAKIGKQSHAPYAGAVWKLKGQNRFQKEAVCCDVMMPLSTEGEYRRVRLINVHLDANVNTSPLRTPQMRRIEKIVYNSDCGMIAGDFSVAASDKTEAHDLDLWKECHPGEYGYTFGWEDHPVFPLTRTDRVILSDMRGEDIEILQPGETQRRGPHGKTGERYEGSSEARVSMPWSSHCGLLSSVYWYSERECLW